MFNKTFPELSQKECQRWPVYKVTFRTVAIYDNGTRTWNIAKVWTYITLQEKFEVAINWAVLSICAGKLYRIFLVSCVIELWITIENQIVT